MRQLYGLVKFIFSIYAFVIFVVLMLLIFPFVLGVSLFGKIKGGNIIYAICQRWADVWFCCCGIRQQNIYETPHDNSRQYVFVFNHISYLDIPVLLKAIRKQHCRILGKAEMAKIPVFGFLYKYAVILVDRSSNAKRAASISKLTSVIQNGMSVVIAPEGTFNTTHHPLKKFYDGAFRVAIETQTPIKPVLFLDTFDRMHYNNLLSLTSGTSRVIFLEEVSVAGLTLNDIRMLKEKVYTLMEEKLICYQASWIKKLA